MVTTLYLGLVSCEELHLSGFLQDTLSVLMCSCINNLSKRMKLILLLFGGFFFPQFVSHLSCTLDKKNECSHLNVHVSEALIETSRGPEVQKRNLKIPPKKLPGENTE